MANERPTSPSPTESPDEPDDFGLYDSPADIPDRIGPYIVREVVGEGGMGRVYRCWDEGLRLDVAVKVIHPSRAASPELRRKFREEVVALARAQHEHVVRVYSADEDAGVPYFAMELLASPVPLTHASLMGSLPLRERIGLMVQACRGVSHANQHNVYHGDLKPLNMLVVRREGHSVAKVTDFGLARLGGSWAGGDHRPAGRTPGYIAPELRNNPNAALDDLTDVYALGVSLREVIGAPRDPGAPWPEGVPWTLRRIARDACAVDRSARIASAEILAERLEEWQEGPATRASARLASLRRHWMLPFAALLVLALAAFMIWPGRNLLLSATNIGRVFDGLVHRAIPTPGAIERARVIAISPGDGWGRAASAAGVDLGDESRLPRRLVYAAIVRRLADAGVPVIVLDVFFTERSGEGTVALRGAIEYAIGKGVPVVLAWNHWDLTQGPGGPASASLREIAGARWGTARAMTRGSSAAVPLLRFRNDDAPRPSLALQAWAASLRPRGACHFSYEHETGHIRVTSYADAARTQPAGGVLSLGPVHDGRVADTNPQADELASDSFAMLTVALPDDQRLREATLDAAEVLAQTTDALRTRLGDQVAIVADFDSEPKVALNGRSVYSTYIPALAIEQLLRGRAMTGPASFQARWWIVLAATGAGLGLGALATGWRRTAWGGFRLAGAILTSMLAGGGVVLLACVLAPRLASYVVPPGVPVSSAMLAAAVGAVVWSLDRPIRRAT